MATQLTKRTVDMLEPRAARYDVYDTELPRFAMRVTPDGVKTFSILLPCRVWPLGAVPQGHPGPVRPPYPRTGPPVGP
jgi:hypothetical protein